MAKEVVVELGIKRELGFLYFVRGTAVWKAPLKRGGTRDGGGKSVKVVEAPFERDPAYLYFLDKQGHVSRAPRTVGAAR